MKEVLTTVLVLFGAFAVAAVGQDGPEASDEPDVNPELLETRFFGHWVENSSASPAELVLAEDGSFEFAFYGPKGTQQTSDGIWQVVETDLMLWVRETQQTLAIPFEFDGENTLLITVGSGQKRMVKHQEPE